MSRLRGAGRPRGLVLLVLAALPALLAVRPAAPPTGVPITVSARALPHFEPSDPTKTRFGALRYVGGFSYTSDSPWLEGVSAIRMLDAERFLAVTDTGFWFAGRLNHDAAGVPAGITDARLAPILDADGHPPLRKGEADAEGLAVDTYGDAIVSFERDARIARYADAAAPFASRPRPLSLPIPRKELRANAGLETLAASPAASPLGGHLVAISERSLDRAGNLFAAVLGPGGGLFTVRRDPAWAATDGAFLPNGDLLLLERRYEGFTRVGMRIRRLAAETLRPGAVADGPVLMEADLGEEIDNMEGLDVFDAADGTLHLVLVSDDNGSFLQRNLVLEFALED